MRDYTEDLYDAKHFILNYEIVEDTIKVHLANGENYEVPNTRENEERLLEQMEDQVDEACDFVGEQKNGISKSQFSIVWQAMMLGLDVYLLVSGLTTLPVLIGICASWFTLDIGYNICKIIYHKNNIKDYKKNRLFLENKKAINDYIRDSKEQEISEEKNKVEEEKPTHTINTIDKLKYEDVQKIVDDIERDKEFGITRDGVKQKKIGAKKN